MYTYMLLKFIKYAEISTNYVKNCFMVQQPTTFSLTLATCNSNSQKMGGSLLTCFPIITGKSRKSSVSINQRKSTTSDRLI